MHSHVKTVLMVAVASVVVRYLIANYPSTSTYF